MNQSHPAPSAHFDVLIIGAGISGIDAAYHLQKNRPGTRFAIVEAKDDIGGTWYTHRFPGIRSDSDLFTFGFKWKPWTSAPIASADEIMRYLNEAIDENGLRRHIRFSEPVQGASWSGKDQRWTVTTPAGQITCNFLWTCAGYYRHDKGYQPDFPGQQDFKGPIIHPQHWPEGLDVTGKRITVIGSGATAATLIPALAGKAAHVTMLQRSPTYYYPRPAQDEFQQVLNALDLPPEWYHEIMRRKFLMESHETVRRSHEEPEALKQELLDGARAYLGPDYDIATHFTPTYRPWRQRVAMIPDGDLFRAIRAGLASVVTDQIDRFTPAGIRLASGDELQSDIIVTATGLTLNTLGDIALDLDGAPVDISQSYTHRGIMFSGVPNLATVFGYLRSSWTLRADLVSGYICRLLDHMDATGTAVVTPTLRKGDETETRRPFIEPDNFNAGYILRGLDQMPRQGARDPWIMTQDFYVDREVLPVAGFEDGTLAFTPAKASAAKALADG